MSPLMQELFSAVVLLLSVGSTFSQNYVGDYSVPRPPNNCGRCPPDHVCVMRPPYCPPGRACILPLVPTCVPRGCENCRQGQKCQLVNTRPSYDNWGRPGRRTYRCVTVDPCGGCAAGHVCIDTGIRCITSPCPTYKCVPQIPCGGCPPGHVCVDTGIRCVTRPCHSHKCVPLNHHYYYGKGDGDS